jgi:hypothetical protein
MYEFLHNLFASEQPVLQKFNVTDPTAVGEGVRSITLAYTPSNEDSPTSVVSLYWSDSKIKVYEKQFRDETQAQKLFGAMKGDLDEAARLTKEEKGDAASSLVRSLLKRYDVYTDELVDPVPDPVTTSNADLKKSKIQNPLVNKTAKVVMQNLFFETPQELMDYQNKMKGKTTGKPESKPLGDFKDDLPPLDDELSPEKSEDGLAPGSLSYEDFEKEEADEQKLLTKRIEREVKDQVRSALDRKIASTFDAADDELIDAMRNKGRTWEEIKEYFIKSLKYDKDSVAAYVDAMREAETGVPQTNAPHPEKPSAPKPPENLVSPETHDKLIDEVSPKPEEEHEIEKQDMALSEIAKQDTEIKKVAEEPLETIPKPHPGMGQDWEFLPKTNETSDDLKEDPAMTQEQGDESDPVFAEAVKPGDNVYVMANYETGEEGFRGTIVSVYKQQGDEWAVIDAGHSDLKEVPMRMVKKADFGGLVNFLRVRKQARLRVQDEFARRKASSELKSITSEIKSLEEAIEKEADSSVVMPMYYLITDKDILTYANGSIYANKIKQGQMSDQDWQTLVKETGRWMPHVGREKVSQHFPMDAEWKFDPEQIAHIKNMFQNLPAQSSLKTESKLPPKKQKELDALVQKAVVGYQIPIMEMSKVYQAAEAAYMSGQDVTQAVHALLDKIAPKAASQDASKKADYGRPMGIKDLENGSFAVVHTDTGAELAMFDSVKEAKEYIRKHSSLDKTSKEHKLVVKSLDDAQAECSAGDWHMSATGPRTREEIQDQFNKHVAQHKEAAKKLKCPKCGKSESVTPAHDNKLNKCDACHYSFDNESAPNYKEAAPGDAPKAPVDPKAPVVEPVKLDVHKKAPPGMREEDPVPATPEVTEAYNDVRDVLHKIELIERGAQDMLAKVSAQIKEFEEQSGKGALIAQQKAALEKLFSVITPLKAKVVEVEDSLIQVTHEKEKEVKDWTTAKQLKMVKEKFPEVEKYLESALNGLQSGAREIEKRRMVMFPKSSLSRFDKTAGLEEILKGVWDSLAAAFQAVSSIVPTEPAPESTPAPEAI